MKRLAPLRALPALLVLLAICAPAHRAAAESVQRETSYVYPPFKHTMGFQRIGRLELKLFMGPGAAFANPQGLAVVKLTSQDGKSEHDDDELNLFMVNSGAGEIFYNPDQYSLKRYGKRGSGDGRFQGARGIAALADGTVIVADTGNRRLVRLAMAGDKLEWRGEVSDADGAFSPTDVAYAGDAIWCTDYSGNRVLRFSPAGDFLGEWAVGLELDGPLSLAVQAPKDDANHSRRFTLVVVDAGGMRVQAWDANARLRARRLASDLVSPPALFGYPVLDLFGQVLLPDSLHGRIVKLDGRLELLTAIDRIDDDEDALRNPNSLALHRRFGQLFVVEREGGSYAWTGTDVRELRLTPMSRDGRRGFQLDYLLTEPSLVSLAIDHADGEEPLGQERRRDSGNVREWLALPEMIGQPAALLIRARPTFSAKKQLLVEKRLPLPAAVIEAADEGEARE